MSRDREAVVWTRLGGRPLKMGRLYVTGSESRFTYAPDFLAAGLPGLGCVLAPEIYGERTLVRPRTERFDLPPPLQALVPPRDPGNFQRRLALRYLKARGHVPLDEFETDWSMLLVVGHGGIGHLDVFEDDETAHAWYEADRPHRFVSVEEDAPLSLRDLLAWIDSEADAFLQMIGPTPSVGGAIPKLLVSIPAEGWDGRIGPPTRRAGTTAIDVVLKLEQPAYPGIAELEAMALDVHRALGFETPRYWRCTFRGIPAIAVERFDRDEMRRPVFVETLFSIIASGNPDLRSHYDFTYDGIAKALQLPELPIVDLPEAALEHLFRRLAAAFLTGNGDLHLENLAIIERDGARGFSPVFDPTPMRAYPVHDLLNVMPFGGYGEFVTGRERPVPFDDALRAFARNCRLAPAVAGDIIEELLAGTADYPERIAALESLPAAHKARLEAIHREMRERLAGVFGGRGR